MRRLLNTISRTLECLADWTAHGRRTWVSAGLSNDEIIDALSPDAMSDEDLLFYSTQADIHGATLLPARITDIEFRRLLLYVYPSSYGIATSSQPDEIVPVDNRVILTLENPTPYILIPEKVDLPSDHIEIVCALPQQNPSPSSPIAPRPDLVIYRAPSGRKVARLLAPECHIRTTTKSINNVNP